MRLLTVRSKKLFFIVRIMVYSLKAIGLAAFSIPIKMSAQINSRVASIQAFQLSKIGLVYNLLLSALFLISTALTLPYRFCMNLSNEPSGLSLGILIWILEEVLQIFTVCLIYITWGFRQKNAANIMNRLLDVDARLSELERQPFNKRTMIFFMGHVIMNGYIWIKFWSAGLNFWNFDKFINSFLKGAPKCVISWFILEYFIVVGLVVKDLRIVNNYLLKFKEFGNYLSRPPVRNGHLPIVGLPTHHSIQLVSIKLLHSVRTTLSDVCRDTADFFSLSILFCVASCFVPLVSRLYMLFRSIDYSHNLHRVTSWTLHIILLFVYPIMSLAFNVTQAENEVKHTGKIVQKLLAVVVSREIRVELEEFSAQLLHEKVKFTAYGFFSLDSTLLQSILGGTATYFIVLLQFELSACTCGDVSFLDRAIGNSTYRNSA